MRKRFFLGEEPATAPGALNIYRDSGMAWGKDGKPVANPKASEDSLTAQPIAPQAEAIANAIRDIKPDVLITYDLDGGYGHPDHVRTHQAVLEALKILGDSNDRPILTWGIEGEFSEQDARQQCAITGSVEAKREAMKAHGTQIVVTGDTTFEFSNKVEQKISAVETYRLLDGNAQRKIPETPHAGRHRIASDNVHSSGNPRRYCGLNLPRLGHVYGRNSASCRARVRLRYRIFCIAVGFSLATSRRGNGYHRCLRIPGDICACLYAPGFALRTGKPGLPADWFIRHTMAFGYARYLSACLFRLYPYQRRKRLL